MQLWPLFGIIRRYAEHNDVDAKIKLEAIEEVRLVDVLLDHHIVLKAVRHLLKALEDHNAITLEASRWLGDKH